MSVGFTPPPPRMPSGKPFPRVHVFLESEPQSPGTRTEGRESRRQRRRPVTPSTCGTVFDARSRRESFFGAGAGRVS